MTRARWIVAEFVAQFLVALADIRTGFAGDPAHWLFGREASYMFKSFVEQRRYPLVKFWSYQFREIVRTWFQFKPRNSQAANFHIYNFYQVTEIYAFSHILSR